MHIRTHIDIFAEADAVWQVLADTQAYPTWNPFVRELSGNLETGEKLKASIQPPGKSAMTFRPRVLVAEPGKRLLWRGHLWVPGLFDGEHDFRIEPLQAGGVRFHHEEAFSGLLLPFMRSSLERHVTRGFEAMNTALKARVEQSAMSAT